MKQTECSVVNDLDCVSYTEGFMAGYEAAGGNRSKTGRWLWSLADNGWADHKCSNCGYTKNTDIHVTLDWRYCPNCGSYNGR